MIKQYAERDAFELDQAGGHYMRHVMAMTAEQLHSKSDIAAELAWRDSQIAALQQKLDELVGLVENVDNSHCMCGAAIDKKYGCGCGHTVGMFDYHYGKWSKQYGSGTNDTADKAG